jgi:hypothetical protein
MKDPFTLLPTDKLLYILGSAFLVYTFGLWINPLYVLAAVIALGVLKEWVWDAKHPETHTVDPWDFAAGCAGAFFAFVLLYLRFK